jgi:hypothetical protein
VALQGTLDTFALIDVFRLLASTNKTGRLRVSGDRGIGNVWFDGGGVVLAAAYNTKPSDAPVAVIFELLRQHEGTFVFEADVTTPEAGAPSDVESLIREAEHLLIEWQEIEAVVPSVDMWVSLSPELPRPEIVVDGERWKVIVATGAGATVAEVGDHLGLGEIAVSKAVKEVVEIGLLTITTNAPARAEAPRVGHLTVIDEVANLHIVEAAPEPAYEPAPEPVYEPAPEPEPIIDLVPEPVYEPEPAYEPEPQSEPEPQQAPASTSGGGALGIDIPGFQDLAPAVYIEKEFEQQVVPSTRAENGTWAARVRAEDAAQHAEHTETEPVRDSDPMLELPNLTPQAARAIAAAAQASTEAERDAALAMATGPDDEPLDRDLLLRFLSSVKR